MNRIKRYIFNYIKRPDSAIPLYIAVIIGILYFSVSNGREYYRYNNLLLKHPSVQYSFVDTYRDGYGKNYHYYLIVSYNRKQYKVATDRDSYFNSKHIQLPKLYYIQDEDKLITRAYVDNIGTAMFICGLAGVISSLVMGIWYFQHRKAPTP